MLLMNGHASIAGTSTLTSRQALAKSVIRPQSGKLRMELRNSHQPTFGVFASPLARRLSERSKVASDASFARGGQKFSICQTFLVGLTSNMASIAVGRQDCISMKLLERSRTETLPSSETFRNPFCSDGGSRWALHSARRACMTSMRAARAAGSHDATTAAVSSANAERPTGKAPCIFTSRKQLPAKRAATNRMPRLRCQPTQSPTRRPRTRSNTSEFKRSGSEHLGAEVFEPGSVLNGLIGGHAANNARDRRYERKRSF